MAGASASATATGASTISGSGAGSIGDSTLDVIARNADRFRVVALTAHRNVEKLADQCARFDARLAVISDSGLAGRLDAIIHREFPPCFFNDQG